MRFLLVIIFILLSVIILKAQTTLPDISVNNTSPKTDTSAVPEFQLNIDNSSYVTESNPPFQHKAFSLKLNLDQIRFDDDLSAQYYHNFYLSTASQGSIFGNNKTQMMNSIFQIYEKSKPTKMEQILGMVKFSGAMILAGYHVYKYYIKKDEK